MGSALSSKILKTTKEPIIDTEVVEQHQPKETKIQENEHIKSYVRMLIKTNKLNNKYIPDFMEEKMYEELLGTIVLHIKQVLSDTKIEFLDHEIRFCFVPKQPLEPKI